MKILKSENRVIDEQELNVSDSYQRTVVRSRVSSIVKNFDQDAFGSLCVGQRADGTLWVVDGFQRLTAARKLGVSRVPCDVFKSEGPSHEARIFRHKNKNRTGVSAATLFKALLSEGDKQAIAIRASVENAGFQIDISGKKHAGWPAIACVVALQNIYERQGAAHLTETLNIVANCWNGDQEALRGTILDGLSLFIHKCKDCDTKNLQKRLKTIEPMAVLRYADSQRKLIGGARVAATATAFLNFYNKGKRNKLSFTSET